ncbi:hypothetical protein [Alienimonas sp. DA493]
MPLLERAIGDFGFGRKAGAKPFRCTSVADLTVRRVEAGWQKF